MVGRSHRFHGHTSLNYVYKRGAMVRGVSLSLKYCPNQKRQTYRVAVVVSKKVSKHAVVRNRIRRRIYEVVRQALDEHSVPHDLVLLAYDEKLADMPAATIQTTVTQLLKKAKLTGRKPNHAIVDTKE